MENYKKKYYDLIDRLRKAIGDNNVNDERYCCVITDIVPELKESEDERIRKNIIAALIGEGYYDCDLTNECIAWVEKQGKQKPFDYENANIQQTDFTPNIEQKPQRIISAEVKEAMYNKPAWSEVDENHVFSITQTIFGAIKHNVIGHKTGDMQINWLRSLKERIEGE